MLSLRPDSRRSLFGLSFAVLPLILLYASSVGAHEVPLRVHLIGYVKVEQNHVSLLLRVPLEAMRDFDFPTDRRGHIQLSAAQPQLRDAALLWIRDYVTVYENHTALAPGELKRVKVSLPSNRAFTSYASASEHMRSIRPASESGPFQNQAWLDLWFDYPIQSSQSVISLETRLAHLGIRTTTLLHYIPAAGKEYLFQFQGNPGVVDLNPNVFGTLTNFASLGMTHILTGWDHLLFIFCLFLPIRKLRPLIPVVTAFTLAHSVTLIASVTAMVPQTTWFPPLIETLIAATILATAVQNILQNNFSGRWKLAFGFGLIHGFGFSYAFSQSLQLAGEHLASALFAFNLGVELGQILVLILALGGLNLLFKIYSRQQLVILVLSVFIAHSAWHWMVDRFEILRQYPVGWPDWNLQLLAISLSWGLLLAIIIGLLWATAGWFNHWQNSTDKPMVETKTD